MLLMIFCRILKMFVSWLSFLENAGNVSMLVIVVLIIRTINPMFLIIFRGIVNIFVYLLSLSLEARMIVFIFYRNEKNAFILVGTFLHLSELVIISPKCFSVIISS